jgi:hypothetical protein
MKILLDKISLGNAVKPELTNTSKYRPPIYNDHCLRDPLSSVNRWKYLQATITCQQRPLLGGSQHHVWPTLNSNVILPPGGNRLATQPAGLYGSPVLPEAHSQLKPPIWLTHRVPGPQGFDLHSLTSTHWKKKQKCHTMSQLCHICSH